jgi:hypothetical protein
MSNYSEISQETSKYFYEIFDKQTTLSNYVRCSLLNDEKLKHLISIKKLSNPIAYLTETEVLVTINENVFDLLDDSQRELLILEALQQLHYDLDKDVLKIIAPEVQTYGEIIRKYGIDTYLQTKEILEAGVDQLGLNEKPKKSKNN